MGGDVGGRVEHLERVLEDVQVVERALLAAAHRDRLGEDDVEDAEPVEQADRGVGMVGREEPPHLGVDPLARGSVGQVGVARGRAAPPRDRREPELVGDPGQAQEPERVVGEDAVRDHPQPPLGEVAEPAERVDHVDVGIAGDRYRHGVHGEVALPQIGHDIAAAPAGEVDRAAAAARPATPRAPPRGQTATRRSRAPAAARPAPGRPPRRRPRR